MGGATHAAQAFETESIDRIAVSSTSLYRWNRSIDCPQETYFASDVMAVETILPAPSPDHAET
jgi:hypothetical protein